MKNVFAIMVLGVAAAVILGISSSPRADVPYTTPERDLGYGRSTMDCSSIEVYLCMWGKGFGYYELDDPNRPKPTTTRYKLQDAALEQCMADSRTSALQGYAIVHENAIPTDRGATQQALERCQRCKARYGTPGGCPKTEVAPSGGGGWGGRGYGGSTYGGRPADKTAELSRCFEQTARDKIAEGYFVKNDGFWRGTKHAIQDLTFWANTEKGGRCGEYGQRGMQWMKPCVERLFGVDKAVLDDITVEEKSGVRGRSQKADWTEYLSPDQMFEANHRATRVVMPDGRRFVLDFWDGISSGNPRMVPESEWAAKWKKAVGDQLIGIDSGVVQLSEDQLRLKDLIKRYGDGEKAYEVYRKTYNPKTVGQGNTKGDPEVWIRSWKLDPW